MTRKHLIRKLKKLGYAEKHITVTLRLSRKLKLSNRRALEEATIINKMITDINAKRINPYIPQMNMNLLGESLRSLGEAVNEMVNGCIDFAKFVEYHLDDIGERAFYNTTGND